MAGRIPRVVSTVLLTCGIAVAGDEPARRAGIRSAGQIYVLAAAQATRAASAAWSPLDSPRVHVFGYGGPVLFDHPITRDGLPGGPYVTWRIAERTAATARVELSDREATTSGGGQDVLLRKVGDTWVVVSRTTTWVTGGTP